VPLAARSTRDAYAAVGTPYIVVAAVVFALVCGTLAVLLVRYRHRPDRVPGDRVAAPRLELAYGALLVLVIAALLAITFTHEGDEDALGAASSSRAPALRVDVVAAQWEWRFSYPGTAVVLEPPGNGDPTVLIVPTGRRILFRGRSQDVLHDFWIPDLRFQRQVWPGHTEQWGLVFPRPGIYQGLCSWFCGLYHQAMHFDVRALPLARFATWLHRRRRNA
jgi:cytochrome c oxidase subunit II